MSRRSPGVPGTSGAPSRKEAQARARFQQAVQLQRQGRLGEARTLLREALEKQPRHADALHLLGLIAFQEADHRTAAELIARAIRVVPDHAAFHSNLGLALERLGRVRDAVASHDRAIALEPRHPGNHVNRGNALATLGRFEAAVESYDRAIALDPANAVAHTSRGVALKSLCQWEAALASHERAIDLQPGNANAHYNRANTLLAMHRPEAAVEGFDRVIALQPGHVEAHVNRGIALKQLNRIEAAMASHERALALAPGHAAAAWNQALVLLLQGDLERGWPLFESRWETAQKADRRDFGKPLWLGEASVGGCTLLLHAEQGLGDTLQFCRYAKLVADRGARVVLEVPAPLAPVLAGLAGVSSLVVRGEPLPWFDFHCPLLSLPLALRTTAASIPADVPYLSADPARLEHWAAELGPRRAPRIGLAWSGRAEHQDDRNRSIPLASLLPHLPPGCECISLQKEVREGDLATLREQPRIRHFGDALRDFADTAALCAQVDLMVSVDTSVAHLAGALGRPTRILLPFSPDWRWQLDRPDSPWYPTVRLYRQQVAADWSAPFAALEEDLGRLCRG